MLPATEGDSDQALVEATEAASSAAEGGDREEAAKGDKDSKEKEEEEKEEGEDEEDEEEEEEEDNFKIVINTGGKDIRAPAARPSGKTDGSLLSGAGTAASAPSAEVVSEPLFPGHPVPPMNPKVYEAELDEPEDKPWRRPDANPSDFFNYGFTEDTWRLYCHKQRVLRQEKQKQGWADFDAEFATEMKARQQASERLSAAASSAQAPMQPSSSLSGARRDQGAPLPRGSDRYADRDGGGFDGSREREHEQEERDRSRGRGGRDYDQRDGYRDGYRDRDRDYPPRRYDDRRHEHRERDRDEGGHRQAEQRAGGEMSRFKRERDRDRDQTGNYPGPGPGPEEEDKTGGKRGRYR